MALEPRNRQEDWYKEMIDAIGEGGGSGLPEVTSADNGKVLTVENGEWTADSNQFVVTLSGSPLKSDKTYAEIVAAVDAGRTVIARQDSTLFQFAGYNSTAVDFVKFTSNGTTVMKRAVMKNGSLDAYSTSTVPPSFAADNGSELIVKNGAWAKQQKKFIVTLTPTEQDFSGEMDKTPQEITAAHEVGQEIVFNIVGYPNFDGVQINADWFTYATGRTYCAACATLVDLVGDMQIGIFTADIADTKTYNTKIYPLTPAT